MKCNLLNILLQFQYYNNNISLQFLHVLKILMAHSYDIYGARGMVDGMSRVLMFSWQRNFFILNIPEYFQVVNM